MEDYETYLAFDKKSSIPFYVREGLGMKVKFHDIEDCNTEPLARKKLKDMGFDPKIKLVVIY